MKFQFHVTINDEDYLAFNRFHLFRFPYGKRRLLQTRLLFVAIFGVASLITPVLCGFDGISLLVSGVLLVGLGIYQLLFQWRMDRWLRGQIKKIKKKVKAPYTPRSTMEFYEDRFVEIAPDERTERSYTTLECVSVVDGRYIYLHLNQIQVYILPTNAFASREEYVAFLAFLETVCPKIDIYNAKK